MLDERATAFLEVTRVGILSHPAATGGWSRPVPVWFEWSDGAGRVFSEATAPKVRRLREDPRAHLLATNQLREPEAWVSVTAAVELGPVDPTWIDALSARYWDLQQPAQRAVVDGWIAGLDDLVLLTLHPTEVRQYGL